MRLFLSLSILTAALTVPIGVSPAATNPSPPPAVKAALVANGYVMYKAGRNPIGKMTYSAARAGGPGEALIRVAIGRRSPSDALVYARAVRRYRISFAADMARDAGGSTATIVRIRTIETFAVLDVRVKA